MLKQISKCEDQGFMKISGQEFEPGRGQELDSDFGDDMPF